MIRGKQIAIKGQKLITNIGFTTPLPCLLDEGKLFGDDFKEKTPPPLPHTATCTCQLDNVLHRSYEWFHEKEKTGETYETDLGMLSRAEFRYYKFQLVANHPEADDVLKSEYRDLTLHIAVSPPFKTKVLNHIHSAQNSRR